MEKCPQKETTDLLTESGNILVNVGIPSQSLTAHCRADTERIHHRMTAAPSQPITDFYPELTFP